MIYAVFSDVHANRAALEDVFDDARRHGAESFVCLGDCVGYGPEPAQTVDLVRTQCPVVVAGNHDDAVSGRGDASAFIDLAFDAVTRHREALDADARAWLRSLPYVAEIEGARVAHGDFVDPASFAYVDAEEVARENFETVSDQLLFVGHTHDPGFFLTGASGAVYALEATDFAIEEGKRYIVNPGSVGYPRQTDGECWSSYVLYDSDERTVRFVRLPFSVASVLQRGGNPKRVKKRTLAGLLAAVACAAALAGWFLSRTRAPVPADKALLVAERTLAVSPATESVRPNLTLAKGSEPVVLRATVADAQGRALARTETTVRRSSTKQIPVRKGASRISFEVLKVDPASAPRIESFDPR